LLSYLSMKMAQLHSQIWLSNFGLNYAFLFYNQNAPRIEPKVPSFYLSLYKQSNQNTNTLLPYLLRKTRKSGISFAKNFIFMRCSKNNPTLLLLVSPL
jgi:hypothetical protein